MTFNKFIFQAWKIMIFKMSASGKPWKIKILYGPRLITADVEARTM